MANPLQYEFWAEEMRRYWGDFAPLVLRILMAGAQGGALELPAGAAFLINWDAFNQAAVDFLNKQGLSFLAGINENTQIRAIKIIDGWVKSGSPMPVLQAQLAPLFGDERARRIAVTEVTRMYAEGNLMAWKSTGYVTEKVWRTARDDRVCLICGPLEGKVVSIDAGWSADASGNIVADYGGLLNPPAHTNCRCWLQPVVSEAAFANRLDQILRSTK